MAQNSTYKR